MRLHIFVMGIKSVIRTQMWEALLRVITENKKIKPCHDGITWCTLKTYKFSCFSLSSENFVYSLLKIIEISVKIVEKVAVRNT